ncbi:MAG: hypothetical protein M3290_12510 [Actinomycetota bacterium]|nr:hypothetical protein [Actinomycetota bacterium]
MAAFVAALSLAMPACSKDAPKTHASPSPSALPSPSATVSAIAGATPPDCKPPKEVSFPDWVPDDLPFPDGTYAYRQLGPISGYKRALFVLPIGSTQFAKMVLKEWPKHGYVLGRGDSEPGEVEDNFSKSPATGAFKTNDVFCTPGYTIMYLIYAKKGPNIPVPTPSPTATASPLVSKHRK